MLSPVFIAAINFGLSSCSVNLSSSIVGAAFRRPRDGKPVPYESINRNLTASYMQKVPILSDGHF